MPARLECGNSDVGYAADVGVVHHALQDQNPEAQWAHQQVEGLPVSAWMNACSLTARATRSISIASLESQRRYSAALPTPTLRATASIVFTSLFNVTDQPAISVPIHHDHATDLPAGVQVVAACTNPCTRPTGRPGDQSRDPEVRLGPNGSERVRPRDSRAGVRYSTTYI